MPAEASEVTPLLAEEVSAPTETPDTPDNNNARADEHYAPVRKPILILTWLSLLLAMVTLVVGVTTILLAEHFAPSGWWINWSIFDFGKYDLAFTPIFTFIGLFNIRRLHQNSRPLWLWLNLPCDLFFMVYLFSFAFDSYPYAFDSWRPCDNSWYQDEDDIARCPGFTRTVRALIGVWSGSSLLLGAVVLMLFLIRCVLACNLWSWDSVRKWSLPRGELTVQFSVKFLKQEGITREVERH